MILLNLNGKKYMKNFKISLDELAQQIIHSTQATQEWLHSPGATKNAQYNQQTQVLEIELNNGVMVSIPKILIKELRDKADQEIKTVTVEPLREGLDWEEMDIHICSLGLIFDVLNNEDFAKQYKGYLSKIGGQSKSEAKARAARENGKKGGRPPKKEKKSA